MIDNPRYVSGQGAASELPPELRTWNWGAFFLNWIWGIGNSTYIALLALFPPFLPIMIIVLGAYGNKWAWQNRTWKDVEHFRSTQRLWALFGALAWFAVIVFFGGLVMMIGSLLKGEAYNKSLAALEANEAVVQVVGKPITPGYLVSGKISFNGATGSANISYSVSGPKGSGDVYVQAYKEHGSWKLHEVMFVKGEKKIKVK